MDSGPEKKSKLPILVIATTILLVSLFPHAQNVIRQIELSDWEQAEGTVTIYEPFNDTFRYNYSVDGIEYTEWRYSFSWDTVSNSEGPLFEEYTESISKNTLRIYTNTQTCVKTHSFTLERGAVASIFVTSSYDSVTDLFNNFPEHTGSRASIHLAIAGGTTEHVYTIQNPLYSTTAHHITEPGNYQITFSNSRQYWSGDEDYWCVGSHVMTIKLNDSNAPNTNFIEGESVTVHYDPNDHNFGVIIMPEFSGLYSSIVALFAVYAFALYAIFNFESKPKSKPEEEEEIPPEPELEGNWWEGDTEEDQSELCDDNPNLHYGVCEFDTYDGICWHCKNLVHPDLHLLHLIHNDRNLFLSFEKDLVEGEKWGGQYRSRLSDIWEEFAERDIMFEAQLGYGAARAEAIQKLCYADKEHILSVLKENLSKAGAPTEGEGTEPWVWNSLEGGLEEHFERIRDWDITRVDWSPEDWHLEKPPDLSAIYKDPPQVSRAIGLTLLAAYGWYILVEGEGMLETFAGKSGVEVDLLCMLYLIPPYFIYTAFIESDVIDDEPPWDD